MQTISTNNLNQARKLIQKIRKENPNEEIAVRAQDDEFNRKILENKEVNVLLNPHIHSRKDRLKQRDSGLNEILCKIAAKNNIKIGIDLNELTKLKKKEKAIAISRIMQNIKLCKRTQTKIIFTPKQSKQEVISFFLTLKASTSQARDAC